VCGVLAIPMPDRQSDKSAYVKSLRQGHIRLRRRRNRLLEQEP
jgi:hypothetical protein